MMNRRPRRIKVSVVVPAHNEEGNIENLLAAFNDTFRNAGFLAEVVMVDDGSTDQTERKIVEGIRRYPFVRMIKNRTRLGLTTALNRGFSAARGDILVFYPADMQFHPSDIPRLVERIDNGADMVCGKKTGIYPKWFVSRIYNLLTKLLFPKLKVTDMNSVKAFTREVYHQLPTMREGWHRYLAVFATAKDFAVREIPVKVHPRQSGKSKFSGKGRILKGLTDLIAVKFQVSVLGDPMHLFGRLSLLSFFLGLIIFGVAVYLRFIEHQGYRPILYVVLFFEISALITFVMGIILETLVYLRDSLTEMKEENQRLRELIGHGRSISRSVEEVRPEVSSQPRDTHPRERSGRPQREGRPPYRRRGSSRGDRDRYPRREEQQGARAQHEPGGSVERNGNFDSGTRRPEDGPENSAVRPHPYTESGPESSNEV